MNQLLTDTMISGITAPVGADDFSFDKIKLDTGYSERDVTAIMHRNLKPKSLHYYGNVFPAENQNTRNAASFSQKISNR